MSKGGYMFWIYVTGVAAYILSIAVCDTVLYYYNNKKSWKGYKLSEISVVWEIAWASWIAAWVVVEDCIGNIRLINKK
jgi:hypothetical protein